MSFPTCFILFVTEKPTATNMGIGFGYETSESRPPLRLLRDNNSLGGWFLFGRNAKCLAPFLMAKVFALSPYWKEIFMIWGEGVDPADYWQIRLRFRGAWIIVLDGPSGHLHRGFVSVQDFILNSIFNLLFNLSTLTTFFEVVCHAQRSFCLQKAPHSSDQITARIVILGHHVWSTDGVKSVFTLDLDLWKLNQDGDETKCAVL